MPGCGIIRSFLVFTGLLLAGLLNTEDVEAQSVVRIFLDSRLPQTAKKAVKEMGDILGASPGVSIQFDSLNKYRGIGIYFTVAAYDYYRKAPVALKKMGAEGVYVSSGKEGVYAVANSVEGFSNIVFTYLDKIGFRFYFPDPAWHIIPKKLQLFQTFQTTEKPAFQYRNIFMGWGYGSDILKERYLFWERANRMGGSLQMKAGHSYQKILTDNLAEFQKHPDYLSKPLVNGKLQSKTAFNFSSGGLAELAYRWLAEQFDQANKKDQYLPMLSLEAFDGPNFCDLPECLKIGDNASDQIFYFTNKVAEKLKRTHPDKLIGVLAYNDHIDVPRYPMMDNIFVTLTSGFNPSPYSIDQLIDRWKKKVKRIGMYDYMSVFEWTNEMPGKGFAGNFEMVAFKMKEYSKKGIISYQAESTYGWIPKGLSHYLASRLAWNPGLAIGPILDKFYSDCFPNTHKWIRPVFESWIKIPIFTENDIYNWLYQVKKAFNSTTDSAELERIHQLALYLKYVTLFKAYDDVKTDTVKAKEAATDLFAYMNQVMEKGVVASYAGINTMAPKLGANFAYNSKAAIWKSRQVVVPGSKKEWDAYLDGQMSILQRMQPVKEYKNAPFLDKQEMASLSRQFKAPNKSQAVSFNATLLSIVDTRNSDSLDLQISGGRIKLSGIVSVRVYKWSDDLVPRGKPLLTARFQASKEFRKVSLSSLPRNKYLILSSDSSTTGAYLYFPKKMRYSIVASSDFPIRGSFYNNYYIYIPKGTKVFYITKTQYLQVLDPAGTRTSYSTQESRLVEIKVKEGSYGWWRILSQLNDIYFTGVPPLLSRDPESFFFPE
jgi:hypothetical protein